MFQRMGPMGGNVGGVAFDDGVFDGVKKVTVGFDSACVTYIKTEYEKDGKFHVRERGTIFKELAEFSVEYPNEYITLVGGSCNTVFRYQTVIITSLFFRTSYGRTSPTLGPPSGRQFILEGKTGGKLLGFHGRSGEAIDAIGPHFFSVGSSLRHFPPHGGNGGRAWDDGVYDGVRRVRVTLNGRFVSYCRFEYARGEEMVPHAHGRRQGDPQSFVVDYPNEHIALVEGTIDGFLSSLMFKTSTGRTSPVFGNVSGRKFVFDGKGFKLVGFCGRSADFIDALGAHFAPAPAPALAPAPAPTTTPRPAPASNPPGMAPRPAPASNPPVIASRPTPTPASNPIPVNDPRPTPATPAPASNPPPTIAPHPIPGPVTPPRPAPAPASNPTPVVASLPVFPSAPTPAPASPPTLVPTSASTGETGSNIGGSGLWTGSFGPQNLEAQGGEGGDKWDDGADHDGVIRIYVAGGGRGIENIRFDYVKNGNTKEGTLHGVRARGFVSTIAINHPDEYLVSVEGWYDSSNIIQGIKFQTNNTTSDFIGYKFSGSGTQFSLQVEGKKIIGFHGFATSHLNSLGAYFLPLATSST